jgi:uncharacterized membrane protein YedE/YeeE
MDPHELFPHGIAPSLLGGIAIGLGVGILFLTTGLIGGMSTLFSSVWTFATRRRGFADPALKASRRWRLVYAAGLVLGAWVWHSTSHEGDFVTAVAPWRLFAGGLVAGFGARLSRGCTAGHGICGLASLQVPSLLAVLVFLSTAIATVRLLPMLATAVSP